MTMIWCCRLAVSPDCNRNIVASVLCCWYRNIPGSWSYTRIREIAGFLFVGDGKLSLCMAAWGYPLGVVSSIACFSNMPAISSCISSSSTTELQCPWRVWLDWPPHEWYPVPSYRLQYPSILSKLFPVGYKVLQPPS